MAVAASQARTVDIAVVGGGAAGLWTALVAAEEGARVALVTRSPLPSSSSYWAQGGLAAALDPGDSWEAHLADTLSAGRGISRESAALVLCQEAPEQVHDLERLGVEFDREAGGSFALGMEGGHSRRRIVHAGGSATGIRVTRVLAARADEHDRIDVTEGAAAQALWVHEGRCIGAATDHGPVAARATVLATGGSAALWERTTNPPGSIGTGISLAHAAGARLADLELMQFHPTAVALPGRRRDGFLVTEAVRGEGAQLLDASGERFVDELAPRDEVARAILNKMREEGSGHVALDMRMVDAARFPNVRDGLAEEGFDVAHDLIPVAPAAHYLMGGIATGLEGETSVPGLYAVGECACTGLHGANRLASNSLSECFVFGRRAGVAAQSEPALPAALPAPPDAVPLPPVPADTRAALWREAGLERDREGLERLLLDPYPLARLIAACALERAESRGSHFRTDHPEADPAYDGRHVVVDGRDARLELWE